MTSPASLARVVVVGTSGAGKTTLAQTIGQVLNLPHIELDDLHWDTNWREVPDDTFKQRVDSATAPPHWIIDGNYSKVRHIIWQKADTLIWLDYPRRIVMWRVLKRTFDRVAFRRKLWRAGNTESLSKALSRDSIIWWAWSTYERRKHEFTHLLAQPEYSHLNIIHFRSPRETTRWLESLKQNT